MSNRAFPLSVLLSKIRKSKHPVVIVEGPDDIIVYRQLINLYSDKGLTVLPSGGRGKALKVFDSIKDEEILEKVIFIVDKDLWVFSEIPEEYRHNRILTTQGYSIENDIFCDGNVETLLKSENCFDNFKVDLKEYLNWYTLVINQHLSGKNNETLDFSAKDFFASSNISIKIEEAKKNNHFPEDLHANIYAEYHNKLRGKNLLNMAIWYLNKKKDSGIFHKDSYIKVIASVQRGNCLNNIFQRVGELC